MFILVVVFIFIYASILLHYNVFSEKNFFLNHKSHFLFLVIRIRLTRFTLVFLKPLIQLLFKLKGFGIEGNLLEWFVFHLTDREQFVRAEGVEALLCHMVCLRILFSGQFILFINDTIESVSFVRNLIYANVVKLFAKVCTPLDSSKILPRF